MLKILRMAMAAILLAAMGVVTVSTAPQARADDEQFTPWQDEPALCGSVVSGLVGYNGAIVSTCIVATPSNTFLVTELATLTDYACHVDLSKLRRNGYYDPIEQASFPFDVYDFCTPVIVVGAVGVPPVPNPQAPAAPPLVLPDSPPIAFTG